MANFRRNNSIKLNDAFPEWLSGGGIFTTLNTFDVPWKTDIQPGLLDIEYHGNYSGSKNVSPVINRILEKDNVGSLTTSRKNTLAGIIYNLNATRWGRLWATLDMEYNPLNNYDMTESEGISTEVDNTRRNTGTQTNANTGTVTNANTGTQTNANTGTITETNTGTQTNANTGTISDSASGSDVSKRYAFNSTGAVNTAEATVTNGNTRTDNTTETRTDDLTDTRTDNTLATRTDNLTETRTDNTTETRTDNLTETEDLNREETRTLTRSGNIGVTSSQQMLSQEREVNIWNIFYSVIFPDIDKVLTISTYSDRAIYHGTISGGGGGGGGDMSEVLEKLEVIEGKVDGISTEITTATTAINTNINAKADAINSNTNAKADAINNNTNAKADNINTNLNAKSSAIELSINQLRVSTFNAIDGVTTRSY